VAQPVGRFSGRKSQAFLPLENLSRQVSKRAPYLNLRFTSSVRLDPSIENPSSPTTMQARTRPLQQHQRREFHSCRDTTSPRLLGQLALLPSNP
jgi:hypothetical protein